jgi:lysyl-tRNA synthetase class 2
LKDLKKTADLFKKIRLFFEAQKVLEVKTPVLLSAPATDVYIDSLTVRANGQPKYLHTSPELEMKKLLSAGSGDIYQICPVFRDNEVGVRNFNEFTLLEYYRIGFDIHDLMQDISHLLFDLGLKDTPKKLTYAQAFMQFSDIDILNTDLSGLQKIAIKYGLNADFDDLADLQMFLFVHCVEPKLQDISVCFIYDYPATQSALAKKDKHIAQRFELFLSGVEVGNGYEELQQVDDYLACFEADNQKRHALNKPVFPLDTKFLQQLQTPLPLCAGVAIGLERLYAQIG